VTGEPGEPTFDPEQLGAYPTTADPEAEPAEPAEPEAAPEAEPVAAPAPQFSYNDRLYALALTRSGKSEILNVMFSGVACQRLLLDPKPEFYVPGLDPVHTPEGIDWNTGLIHYQPQPGSDCAQYEQIFADAWTRNALLICIHELAALVDYQPGRAGRYMVSYCAQGGAKGKGLLAGTTRPFLVPTAAIAEATHVLVLPPQLAREDDMKAAAAAMAPVNDQPFTRHDLAAEMTQLPRYGFLWKDRRQEGSPLHSFPPLTPEMRARSIVKRSEDAPS